MSAAPDKTLVCVVHIPDAPEEVDSPKKYMEHYGRMLPRVLFSTHKYAAFGPGVILNDYEEFIDKVYHTVKSV